MIAYAMEWYDFIYIKKMFRPTPQVRMGLTTNVQLYLLVIYYAHPEATTYFLSEDKFWVKATTMRHPVSIDLTNNSVQDQFAHQ